jgi:hypothetical protein
VPGVFQRILDKGPEGSFVRSKGLIRHDVRGQPFGHGGIRERIKFFSHFTRHIVITHFGTWFFKNVAASGRKLESLENAVRVIAANDGDAPGREQTRFAERVRRKRHGRILRLASVEDIPCYRWGRDSEFYCLYRGIR